MASGIILLIKIRREKMTNYKMIVSDLDGTLLNKKMETGEKNDAAIREFARRGMLFVPSSGRTYYEIPECLRENPDIRYTIYSNGTAVYDKKEEKLILSNEISEKGAKAVIKICKNYDVYLSAHFDGRAYVPNIFGKENMAHYQINEYYQNILKYPECYGDISTLEARRGGVESFVLFFHDDTELLKCKDEFSKIPGILVTASVAHNLEVVSAHAGKGKALSEFAKMMGIKKEEIIVIGDSTNDISMFEAAGLSLSAKNGNEEAKNRADKIICSNEEGVADYVLKNIV